MISPCPPPHPFLRPCVYIKNALGCFDRHFVTAELEGSYCLGDGRGKVDPRLASVVRYRIGRKESHSMAAGVLEEFLTPAPSPPAPPATAETKPEQEEGEEKESTAKESGGE